MPIDRLAPLALQPELDPDGDSLAAELAERDIDWLVTTAQWTDAASLRSFIGSGFSVRGSAAERVVGASHRYRLPDAIALSIPPGATAARSALTLRLFARDRA